MVMQKLGKLRKTTLRCTILQRLLPNYSSFSFKPAMHREYQWYHQNHNTSRYELLIRGVVYYVTSTFWAWLCKWCKVIGWRLMKGVYLEIIKRDWETLNITFLHVFITYLITHKWFTFLTIMINILRTFMFFFA
jgi:hypothetical protein